MLVEGVTITEEGAVADVVVVTVGDKEPKSGVAVVGAVTDVTEEVQVVVSVDVDWVDLGFLHPEKLMSALTSSRSTFPHTLVSMSFFHFNCDSCRSRDM